jgi:hypothetical protein
VTVSIRQLLEKAPDPIRVLEEEKELVAEIIGIENLDCLKVFLIF